MDVQGNKTGIASYWDHLFVDLAGVYTQILSVSSQLFYAIIDIRFLIFFIQFYNVNLCPKNLRSANERLAPYKIASPWLDDHWPLSLLCELMGTAIHERSQTISVQKHTDHLQLYPSAYKFLLIFRGEQYQKIESTHFPMCQCRLKSRRDYETFKILSYAFHLSRE